MPWIYPFGDPYPFNRPDREPEPTWKSGPVLLPPAPAGCICPPTSEQTCMNPLCPRKAPSTDKDTPHA